MEHFGPCFGGVVGELGVNDMPDRVGPGDRRRSLAADDDRRDRHIGQARARERQRLERGVVDRATVVIDQDENGVVHPSPNSASRSTTAPAASAPVPSTTVSVTSTTGVSNRTMVRPPFSGVAANVATSAFF